MNRRTIPWLLVALALLAEHALAETAEPASEPRFGIKEAEPRTGTNIRRDAYISRRVPINKAWHELTPDQQNLIKSQYEHLGDTDEPPYPVDGTVHLAEAIKKAEAKLLVEGDLSMFVEVDATGQAQSVIVQRSPSEEMTKFVSGVLMLEKYKPALCDGTPCTMYFPVRLTFRLMR